MKSPTTATRRALGAQTAKRTPGTPSIVIDLGAEGVGELEVPALVEQMQIELAEQQAERIRVLGLLHAARPGDPQQIGLGVRHPAFEQAFAPQRSSRPSGAPIGALRTASTPSAPGTKGAHDAAVRRVMRAEHRERDRRQRAFASASAMRRSRRQGTARD